ncbi:SLC13 family permease [Flammeovirgaceae bacterium SG7u.111]|nr:SLC13 family permease [Flammeovirgaceae bacterium SG7u.132]WPO37124.1 SLC13 family permease [Flammeovirgaceae bacterium SG7u.111]
MDLKKTISGIAGPLAFIIIQGVEFEGLSPEGRAIMASTAWVAIWWIFETLPMAVTALLPIVLFPLTGGMDIKTTTTTYFSPLVVLYLGGFIIALAIEKWELHQRIALNIIKVIGSNTKMIVLGFMVATAFLSMWISNTATTLMMLPIGMAIANQLGKLRHADDEELRMNFNKSLVLAIAYAASIGGMATLIGTPTNAIFSAISIELYDKEVSFSEWFSFGLPVSTFLLFIAWLYLTSFSFKSGSSKIYGATDEVDKRLKMLGKMGYEEKLIAIVFGLTALAWMLRSFVLSKFIPNLNDTIIAIAGAIVLFIIPSKEKGQALMDWETAKKLPWGVLLLFGGGLAIAASFKNSGLADWFALQMAALESYHYAIVLLAIILMVNFFTEITSNVATAAVVLPILASMSQSIDVHPFGLMIGACFAASCAFMLPVATPPNAIVYSSGYLKVGDMIRTGVWLNILTAIILFLCIYFLLPLIWGIDMMKFPF